VAVRTAAGLPENMVAVRVPGVRSLLLEARGPMPGALHECWQQVRQHTETGGSPSRAFTTDVEIHHPGGVDLYVAVLAPLPSTLPTGV
jgi:predicted transcriptional regulator YdeE